MDSNSVVSKWVHKEKRVRRLDTYHNDDNMNVRKVTLQRDHEKVKLVLRLNISQLEVSWRHSFTVMVPLQSVDNPSDKQYKKEGQSKGKSFGSNLRICFHSIPLSFYLLLLQSKV